MTAIRPAAGPPPTAGPDGPVCAQTELPVAWCGHCRNPQAGHRALRDQLSRRADPRAVDLQRRILARCPGPCARCDRDFRVGELIGITVDQDYVCGECAR